MPRRASVSTASGALISFFTLGVPSTGLLGTDSGLGSGSASLQAETDSAALSALTEPSHAYRPPASRAATTSETKYTTVCDQTTLSPPSTVRAIIGPM